MPRQIYGTRYIPQDRAYRITFAGALTKEEARAECARLNALLIPDFDTGLGIGGLARHEEPPPTPTAREIRGEAQSTLRRCGRCGQTGAMFTTDPARGVCDDCF